MLPCSARRLSARRRRAEPWPPLSPAAGLAEGRRAAVLRGEAGGEKERERGREAAGRCPPGERRRGRAALPVSEPGLPLTAAAAPCGRLSAERGHGEVEPARGAAQVAPGNKGRARAAGTAAGGL